MHSLDRTTPNRPFFQLSTEELRSWSEKVSRHPVKLSEVYFELQFRHRKCSLELREHIRNILESFEGFKWPSIEAGPSNAKLKDTVFEHDVGVLKILGYSTGIKGLGQAKRKDILQDLYLKHQPILRGHPQEMDWGKPRTAKRLKKMANVIATSARNGKRKNNPPLAAISDWENDLKFLKREYYDGKFDFQWPNAEA